jgi:hypothetical protein
MHIFERWLHSQPEKLQVLYDLLVEQNIVLADAGKDESLYKILHGIRWNIMGHLTSEGANHRMSVEAFNACPKDLLDMYMYALTSFIGPYGDFNFYAYDKIYGTFVGHYPESIELSGYDKNARKSRTSYTTAEYYSVWLDVDPNEPRRPYMWGLDAKWEFTEYRNYTSYYKKVKSPLWQ